MLHNRPLIYVRTHWMPEISFQPEIPGNWAVKPLGDRLKVEIDACRQLTI